MSIIRQECNIVDFLHNAVGLTQGGDDALVMADVLDGQIAALAVFEPFLRGLVAADIKLPRHFRDLSEILGRVDPDLACCGVIPAPVFTVIPAPVFTVINASIFSVIPAPVRGSGVLCRPDARTRRA